MITLASAGNAALMIFIILFTMLFFGGIAIFALIKYMAWKKYTEFDCIIFQEDGFGQLTQRRDGAGIFVDSKTNNKRFYMRKNNVGLSPDNVPYIPNAGGGKTVYLLQTGLKNFHYIRMSVKTEGISLSVGEEDVNWAINAYDKQKKMFQNPLLMQLLPYIGIAFTSICILVIFIYFFREFSVLRDMAVALRDAAVAFAQAKAGTTIIGGG